MRSIKRSKKSKKWIWISLVVLVFVLGGGVGYFLWTQQTAALAATSAVDSTTKTTQVREGSITISASGSGTLIAGQERALGFTTAGTVAKLSVQVGDAVEQGDLLAQLDADTLANLQSGVTDAQQTLLTAQQALDSLTSSTAVNLANAQLAMSVAQSALSDAQGGALQAGMTRCDPDTIEAKYFQMMRAQQSLDELGDGGGSSEYYLSIVVPAKNAAASAEAAYEYCAGFFDYEINASQANLTLAKAAFADAQANLEELNANNGFDPLDLAMAENQAAAAELALTQAEDKLAGAAITAPFDGTVLSVAGEVGDTGGTAAFITLADLGRPRIDFSVDETDLDKVFVGEQAVITFDAVPNREFIGTVIRVNPALENSGGYNVLKGLIELDLNEQSAGQDSNVLLLPKGLNATVELVAASTEKALLVPLQALRDLGDGSYSVFVVGADGQPRMKVVEVGLQDAASAEIKSGLALGDVVTTGVVETK